VSGSGQTDRKSKRSYRAVNLDEGRPLDVLDVIDIYLGEKRKLDPSLSLQLGRHSRLRHIIYETIELKPTLGYDVYAVRFKLF
jgi:hypothetical protein